MIVGTALLGLFLGSSSRRLLGDYLAIVTLFFGQAFVVFVNNANADPLPRRQSPDRRPNGLANVDPLHFFGFTIHSTTKVLLVLHPRLVGLVMMTCSTSSTSRARAAPGARCARIRSPPR